MQMPNARDRRVTRGGGNVFDDLGYQDAQDRVVKAELVSELKNIIDREGWTKARVAKVMGIAQPDVSRLLRGQFSDYSIDRIMRFLRAAGCEVEIVVRRRGERAQTIRLGAREAA
jgi:predicted XRE-type DNA-binding protein